MEKPNPQCLNQSAIEILTKGYSTVVQGIDDIKRDVTAIRVDQAEIKASLRAIPDHERRLRGLEEHSISLRAVASRTQAMWGIALSLLALFLTLANIVVGFLQ